MTPEQADQLLKKLDYLINSTNWFFGIVLVCLILLVWVSLKQ